MHLLSPYPSAHKMNLIKRNCQFTSSKLCRDAYSMGQLSSNLTYFDGIIKLKYENGDTAPPGPRQTQIAFLCDKLAGVGSPLLVTTNSTVITEIEWKTEYACPNVPVECMATNADKTKQYDLSRLVYTCYIYKTHHRQGKILLHSIVTVLGNLKFFHKFSATVFFFF